MAREYGNDRTATVAVRLTKEEKERLKAAAQAQGLNISELIRNSLSLYLERVAL